MGQPTVKVTASAARSSAEEPLLVIEQVLNLCHTSIVRDAWQRGQTLAVHGWIYGLQDGLLRDLDTTVTQPDEVATSYREALSKLS